MTATQTPPETDSTKQADERIERLNRASLRRVIEPDEEVTGTLSKEQVIPDELLSTADLDLDLTPEQRATLSKEELASIVRFGILFEAILLVFIVVLVDQESIKNGRVCRSAPLFGTSRYRSIRVVRTIL